MTGRVGIVDWGIGGLDLYRKLRAVGCPDGVLYWSDAGAPPYGTLAPDALATRLATVISRLAAQGCARVVVACNAASTVLGHPAVGDVVDQCGCRVLGVIAPAVAAVISRGLAAVTVIGGRRTIESEAYARPLAAAGCRVTGRIAQPLSALIERGLTEGPQIDACLAEILDPVGHTEHLVLACTHYVAARSAIERRLPRLRTIIDPAAETVLRIATIGPVHEARVDDRFVTTGDAHATRTAAMRAFGIELVAVDSVRLDG